MVNSIAYKGHSVVSKSGICKQNNALTSTTTCYLTVLNSDIISSRYLEIYTIPSASTSRIDVIDY